MERCEACKNRFEPLRASSRFCLSCRWIIETQTADQEGLLFMAIETSERSVQEELTYAFRNWFSCQDCFWEGNGDRRVRGTDPRMLVPYIRDWVIADLKHRLRHAFPGRFLPCRRFERPLRKREQIIKLPVGWKLKNERQVQSEFLKRWDAEFEGKNLQVPDWARGCLETQS